MRTTKQCPAGRYCVAGLDAETDAVDCEIGKYCPEGKQIKHFIIYLFLVNGL